MTQTRPYVVHGATLGGPQQTLYNHTCNTLSSPHPTRPAPTRVRRTPTQPAPAPAPLVRHTKRHPSNNACGGQAKAATRGQRSSFGWAIILRMATNPTYVTLREAAESLGVHESTVRRYADRGLIHAARLPSGVRRLRRADVEALRHPTGPLDPTAEPTAPSVTIATIAAEQGVQPLKGASELAALDIWVSDEEVDLFNAAFRSERDHDR
jgi:excisionase family DNA binding protein